MVHGRPRFLSRRTLRAGTGVSVVTTLASLVAALAGNLVTGGQLGGGPLAWSVFGVAAALSVVLAVVSTRVRPGADDAGAPLTPPTPATSGQADAAPVRIGRAPRRAECFQNRDEIRVLLDEALSPSAEGGATAVLTSVLSGLGGVGKSQLAIDFWSCWCADRGATHGVGLWVTATNRTAILDAYAEAARAIAPGDPGHPLPPAGDRDAAANWFLTYLGRTRRPWLVVLDDVADPADLQLLWPTGATGSALITTRRKDAALQAEDRRVIAVGLFTVDQSRSYLASKLGEAALLDGADGLARDVQHLPLALAQAASFVLDRPGETCTTYRARFADRRQRLEDLFPADALPDDYRSTVATTWSLSVDAADALEPVGVARPLLELAALLDANGFPMELLLTPAALSYAGDRARRRPSSAALGSPDCRAAAGHLARFSLADIDGWGGPRAVRVHALVQRATRDRTDQFQRAARAAADALLDIWSAAPESVDVRRSQRENAVILAQSAKDELWGPEPHTLLFRAGAGIGEDGRTGEAKEYWAALADESTTRLGPDHEDTRSARALLAAARADDGSTRYAESDYETLIEQTTRLFGADDPRVHRLRLELIYVRAPAEHPATTVSSLSTLLTDHIRAQRALRSDDTDRLGAAGERSVPTFMLISRRLIEARARAGDAPGALRDYPQLIADYVWLLEPDHHEVLDIRYARATTHIHAGEPDVAARQLKTLLPDAERLLGQADNITLLIRTSLGEAYARNGLPQLALTELRDAFSARLGSWGKDHPSTLRVRHLIAAVYGLMGDTERALFESDALLTDQLRALGVDHPDVAVTEALCEHLRRGGRGGAGPRWRRR